MFFRLRMPVHQTLFAPAVKNPASCCGLKKNVCVWGPCKCPGTKRRLEYLFQVLSAHSFKVGFLPEPGAYISSSGPVSIPYDLELELEKSAECLACYTGADL